MAEEQAKPLSIYFDGDAPFEKMLRTFLLLNELYRSIGGDGLKVHDTKSLTMITELESEYEVNPGSSFANKTTKLEPSFSSPCIPREGVYAAVQKYARPERAQDLRKALDARFPVETWDGDFPLFGAYQFLVNEHLEDLVLDI
jgi:hypothetical protein